MILKFSELAQEDLGDIFAYIHETLANPIAAQDITDGILRVAAQLKDFSELGPSLASLGSRGQSIRYLLASNYLIAYVVLPSHVEIVRILYTHSDYKRILQG
jgi:plasmid stabilization system protein ParE